MSSAKRFEYIDALRGIAIIGVIITHVSSIVGVSGIERQLTNVMGMGVQLFFVVSAFTIFYTLSRATDNPHYNRDFFIKRLYRIIPVYWAGIILYTAVYGLDSRGWRDGPELWHYPFHIFLVNVLHPSTSSSVVPGGWSISVEVMFYMIAPLIFFRVNTTKRIIAFMLICLIVLPVFNILMKKFAGPVLFADFDPREVRNFFFRWPISQLACFGFGLVLFKIIASGKHIAYLKSHSWNKVFLVLSVVCIFGSIFLPSIVEKHHFVSFFFMLLGLLLSVTPWALFVNKFTVFMGKISYSSYLVHFLIINQLYIFIGNNFPSVTTNIPLFFTILLILSFPITVVLAQLGYKFIETPTVRAGRNLIDRLNKKSTATPAD